VTSKAVTWNYPRPSGMDAKNDRAYTWQMAETFKCPHCGALYEVTYGKTPPAIGMRGTARCAEDPWTPGAMGRFHTTSSSECQTARIFELASDQSIRSANLPRPPTRLLIANSKPPCIFWTTAEV